MSPDHSPRTRRLIETGRSFVQIRTLAFIFEQALVSPVFCPKCGAQNADGVSFCQSCGTRLDAAAAQPASTPGTAAPNSPMQGKSPIVAAILNLFFGAGYLYLGYKKVLGVQAIAFVVIALVLYIILGFFTIGILSFVLAILLAVDGWQKGSGQKGFINAEL